MALEIGLKSFRGNSIGSPEGEELCCPVIMFSDGFCHMWPDLSALGLMGSLQCQPSSPAVSALSCHRHNQPPVLQFFPSFYSFKQDLLVFAFSVYSQLHTYFQINVTDSYFVLFDTFVHTLQYLNHYI